MKEVNQPSSYDPYNTIWVAAVARTGTTWTTNVVREILALTNHRVLPIEQFQDGNDCLDFFKRVVIRDTDINNKYVLAVHKALRTNLPRSKFITNIRNPYDVCASYYQFMKCDLTKAILAVLDLPKLVALYSQIKPENVFILRFERIENEPLELITDLSKFVGIQLTSSEVQHVCDHFCKETVKKMITDNDLALLEKIKKNEKIHNKEIVIVDENNFRSFDPKTGFQTGHISEREPGQWKSAFQKMQIEKIIDALDDIAIEFGYSSER